MRLKIYVGVFAAGLGGILASTIVRGEGFGARVPDWLFLTLLYAATEYVVTRFHHARGSIGLSTAEAVFLPMLVGLSFSQTVWGVTLGAAAAVVAVRRMSATKAVFNVAQFGVSAAAAAGLWSLWREPSATLTLRNALLAAFCTMAFATITHLSVAVVIAITERIPLTALSVAAGRETLLNLAGNIALGLLFSASYLGARWTILVFPLPLIALFVGYRAFLRQAGERERVEHLHEASRALAAGADLRQALEGFLRSVADVASASEARTILEIGNRIVWSGVRGGELVASMDPVAGGPMVEVLDHLRRGGGPIVRGTDDASADFLRLGATNFVAVPLVEGTYVTGALMVLERVGADEFGDADARLLESLANELVLTLDSYRLFAEITEERERFRRIFSSSKEGICLLDGKGAVRAWNPALERITGYASEEVMGRVWSERVLVRDAEQRRLEGLDLVRSTEDAQVELVTKEGPTRWIVSLASPITQAEGGGWVVLIRDVTAEHEAEEAKSDFLSTMSHELRTPLTTIKGSLQVLARGPDNVPSDMFEQMIGVMSRGANRLERLVMNLLIVSQIESGSLTVFSDEVDLESIVRLRTDAMLRDHEVDLRIEGDHLVVRGDQERLAQTVDHLLDNARKYGGDGKVTIELGRDDGYVLLSVTDQGPGIPAADRERVFERFVRLGNVLTRETQGAGVGLFIARRSVEAMGGKIWAEPAPGGGSTFHMRMPGAHPVAVSESAS